MNIMKRGITGELLFPARGKECCWVAQINGTDHKTGRLRHALHTGCAVFAAALILTGAVSCGRARNNEPADAAAPTTDTAASAEQTTAAVPTTAAPTTAAPTSAVPTTAAPTTAVPTTAVPTSAVPTSAVPANAAPASKAEIVSFFAAAVNDIKNNGSASYDKVEYQKIHDVNMTGNATVDGMIRNSIGSFAKDENSAPHIAAQKGTASSKDNMLGWGLADDSAVVSASLQETGGNYLVTLVMADEDTPDQSNPRHLEKMGSVMYLDEVEGALSSVPQMKEFGDIHIVYTGYTVTAELTPEGRLVSLRHHCNAQINLGHMKILVISLDNKSISLENFVEYKDFIY